MRLRISLLLLVLLVAGAGTVQALAHRVPVAHGFVPRAGMVDLHAPLAQLVTAPIPYRNLYALADQLKLRPSRPIARVIRTTSPNYPVGHQESFFVLGEDANRYFTMRATIEAEAPHIYIYVQNGLKVSHAALQAAANTFERHIYPTDRAHFGSEWRPGVDGDPHIVCLLGNLRSQSAGGFYSAEDEFPRLVNPYSNQHEMIYLNATYMVPGNPGFDLTMAHEFQHMIHWHMHPHDNAWLNEGMSMLAEYLNGYAPSDEVGGYLSLPDTQLNSWSLDASSLAHYGAAYLFLSYLYTRFGSGFIHDMLADGHYTDFALIDDVLRKRHINTTADKLFTQWVVANEARNGSIDGGVYRYPEISGPLSYQTTLSAPFSYHASTPPYAAQYLVLDHLSGRQSLHLTFSAPSTVPLLHLTGAGPFWWGNRGDMSNTTLERTVDLRRVKHATLQFQTAYNIEDDYDYAYVEASTDGGKTWTTLRGTTTTTANPNGASYGNGFTGNSKGQRNEVVDLSRYAGHTIRLRFAYVTDDEYTGEGIILKNIAIPEIGWHDTFTGWTLHGFVPVYRNVLPSTWHVQLVSYGKSGMSVSRVPVTAGHGSLTLHPAKSGVSKIVVVVSSAAAKSTVSSTYHLSGN